MRTDSKSEFHHNFKTGKVKSLPVLVLLAGSFLSITSFFVISHHEQSEIKEEFQNEVKNHSAALKKSLDDKLQILNTIIQFFKASVSVDRDEFSEFVAPFLESPATEYFAWAPRIIDSQKESFQKKATDEGLENFMIFEFDDNCKPVPAAKRKEHFPLYYLAPEKTTIQKYGMVLGYDFISVPSRVEVLNYSIDTGKPVISEEVSLPTNDNKYGFLVFVPVYKTGAILVTTEDRRKNLEGFIVSLVKINELIEESLSLVSTRGIKIQLFDLDDIGNKKLIYGYIPGLSAEADNDSIKPISLRNKKLEHKEVFTVANRKWLLESYPTPALITLFRTTEPWIALIGGHILTLICVAYLVVSGKRTAEIEGLVQLRTSELNKELNEHKLTEQALRDSETQFRTLVENIPGAVFRSRLYPPWEMEHISKPIIDITGYSSEDFIKRKINIGDLIIPSDYKIIEDSMNQNIKSKELYFVEYGIYHANGSIRYIHERGNTAYGKDNKPLYFDGVMIDITDRKKYEEEREHLVKAVERKNKELQSIVYVASHDLRSPLVNIMGFSNELEICCRELKDLLNNDILTDDNKTKIEELLEDYIPQSLKFIGSGTYKINTLIDGLLQVSRAGSVRIKIEPLDMNTLVGNVVENLIFHVRELGATITVEELPPCHGDGPMVNQVFSNLIGNALKYLDPERKGKIKITGELQGKNCVYCVSDNGVGIPENCTEKIFELFQRLNPSDGKGGEGLGLTIIIRILDRLGGNIRVESKLGQGSKFYVTLPKV